MHKQLAGLGFMIVLSGCATTGAAFLTSVVGTGLSLPNLSPSHGRELIETHMSQTPIPVGPSPSHLDRFIPSIPSNRSGQQIRVDLRGLFRRRRLYPGGQAVRDQARLPLGGPARELLRPDAVHSLRGALQLLHQYQGQVQMHISICACMCMYLCMQYVLRRVCACVYAWKRGSLDGASRQCSGSLLLPNSKRLVRKRRS